MDIIKVYSRLAANILSISTLLKTHLKQILGRMRIIRPVFFIFRNFYNRCIPEAAQASIIASGQIEA